MSQIIQALTFNLASPIDATQTTIPVRNLKDSRGRAITAWPSALVVYSTLEPRSGSNQEIISIAGMTNNGNGVVTFTGVVRNLDPLPPYATLGGSVPHSNNAEGILSNNPPFYSNFLQSDQNVTITGLYQFPAPTLPASPATKSYSDAIDAAAVHKTGNESVAGIKAFSSSPTVPTPSGGTDAANKDYVDTTTVGMTGNETIDGVKTFNASPVVPTPVSDFQAATKKYIDDMAIAGAPNASDTSKGIVETSTLAEAQAGTATGGTGAPLVVRPDILQGVLSALLPSPAKIVDSFVTGTVVSAGSDGTTTTTILTTTLPAGFFTANTGIKVSVAQAANVNCGNGSSSANINIKLGGTTIKSQNVATSSNGSSTDINTTNDCISEFFILNNASLSSQRIISSLIAISQNAIVTAYRGIKKYELGIATTSTVNTTGAVDLVIEFNVNGGNLGSASMTNKSIIIEKIQK